MAYAHQVIRWTFQGTAFNSDEIWTTGFFTGNDASDIPESGLTQATVDAVAARWTTWFQSTNTNISAAYKTDFVKAAVWKFFPLDHKNLTVGEPLYHNYATKPTGSNTGAQLPAQLSLVASLLSGYRSGPASHGRMYLPGLCWAINSSGVIPSGQPAQIANQFLTFINGVNTDSVPGGSGKIILAGQKDGLTEGANSRNAYVTKIKIGNVYDTQRRRRNSITETYSELGVA